MSFSLGRDYHSAPVLGSDPEVARALLELGRARHLNVPEKPETVGQNGAKRSRFESSDASSSEDGARRSSRSVKLSRKGRETDEPTGVRKVRHVVVEPEVKPVEVAVPEEPTRVPTKQVHNFLQQWLCQKMSVPAPTVGPGASVEVMRSMTASLIVKWREAPGLD